MTPPSRRMLNKYEAVPPFAMSAPDLYRNCPTAPSSDAARKQTIEPAGVRIQPLSPKRSQLDSNEPRPWGSGEDSASTAPARSPLVHCPCSIAQLLYS